MAAGVAGAAGSAPALDKRLADTKAQVRVNVRPSTIAGRGFIIIMPHMLRDEETLRRSGSEVVKVMDEIGMEMTDAGLILLFSKSQYNLAE